MSKLAKTLKEIHRLAKARDPHTYNQVMSDALQEQGFQPSPGYITKQPNKPAVIGIPYNIDFMAMPQKAPDKYGEPRLPNRTISFDPVIGSYSDVAYDNNSALEPRVGKLFERHGNFGSEPSDPQHASWQPNSEKHERAFWNNVGKGIVDEHPSNYPLHDGHSSHHHPSPLGVGDVKSNITKAEGGISYETLIIPFGHIDKTKGSNLKHYDYSGKLNDAVDLVRKHGIKPINAKDADLSHHNYDTGHIVVHGSDTGDFEKNKSNDAWRHLHELAHALTLPKVNKVYGEGRRVGNVSDKEIQRALHWAHEATHKQRALSQAIGIHISDKDFNKEYNTTMLSALSKLLGVGVKNHAQEGFVPNEHPVPLAHILDLAKKYRSN